jgi:hypothetical protein
VIALWAQNLIHLVRSRLLIVILFFTVFVQYFAVKLAKGASAYFSYSFQGNTTVLKQSESYFVAVIAGWFAATFLAAVYGAWIAPYLHRGPRSALTHMLPISRWAFPGAHALTFGVLLLLQLVALFWSVGTNFGWNEVFSAAFPFKAVLYCFLLQSLACYTILFGAAAASMMIGSLPTFFLTNLACTVLVAAKGVIFFSENPVLEELGGGTGTISTMRWLLNKLPPFAELVPDLWAAFGKLQLPTERMALWAIWLGAFVVWFRWRLTYPHKVRASEG